MKEICKGKISGVLLKITLVLVLYACILLIPTLTHARTVVETPEITGEAHWNKEGSPYIIKSNLTITASSSLTIGSGTVVKFGEGNIAFRVYGKLNIKGTPTERVHFTSIYDGSVGGSEDGFENDPQAHQGDAKWRIYLYSPNDQVIIENASFSYTSESEFITSDSPKGAVLENVNFKYGKGGFSLRRGFYNLKNLTFDTMTGYDLINIFFSSVAVLDTVVFKNISVRNTFNFFGNADIDLKNTSLEDVGNAAAFNIFGDAVVKLKNVALNGGSGDGINFFTTQNGYVELSSTTIKNYVSGIQLFGKGNFIVKESTITKNQRGLSIFSRPSEGLTLTISSSTIAQNSHGIVNDASGIIVKAQNNWWGDATGPFSTTSNPTGLGNSVKGLIAFTPWRGSDFYLDICCSNVAFLPGIQASRLYKDNQSIFGSSTNRLWEPNRNEDVKNLFLNSDGKSVVQDIYAQDIIDRALLPIGPSIYANFIGSMDALQKAGVFKQWKPFAYDWRLNFGEVRDKILAQLKDLAKDSRTGKVTFIAHSNGGLLAKVLVDEIKKQGIDNIIDRIIFVGVPGLGTPAAVAALLHGHDQSLGGGLLLGSEVARAFGENMPGAYNLLPSEKYFNQVADPTVTFDEKSKNLWLKDVTGSAYTVFKNFLTSGREKPQSSDLVSPNILNSKLLSVSETNHQTLDSWVQPAHIKVAQIVGWGIDTVKGIDYVTESRVVCDTAFDRCLESDFVTPNPRFTTEGDKTVVYPSALSVDGGENYYLNLHSYNKVFRSNKEHKNMLEVPDVQDLIAALIKGSTTTSPFVTKTKPIASREGDRITLTTTSLVTPEVKDGEGNRTGKVPNPEPSSDLEVYEEHVPNSYYANFAGKTYVGFEATPSTSLSLAGVGSGTFSVEITKQTQAGTEHYSFKDILVTPLLKADIDLFSQATSAPVLILDIDGDGFRDIDALPTEETNPLLFLEILKLTVPELNLPHNTEKQLLNKIEKALKSLQGGKNKKAGLLIRNFSREMEQRKSKSTKLTEDQKATLTNYLDKLLTALN